MRRSWLYFVPAALIVVTAGIVRLTSDGGPVESVTASASTSSTSLAAPVVTTTTVVEQAPHQPEDATPVELDLSGIDLGNSDAVAAAWGCGYWAHPRGETADGLAQRLAPVATPEMTAAVAELRMPDFGADVVEVYPGAIERTSKMTYTIGCRTLTAGPDGAPTAPPAAVLSEITLVFVPASSHWLVAGATVGGLVLP
jgi:hypothetical protein